MKNSTEHDSAEPAFRLDFDPGLARSVRSRDLLALDQASAGHSLSAEMYYVAGKKLENKNCEAAAIEYFQKSLACVPNFLGITPEYARYLFDDQQPPAYKGEFVSEIYAALARCLYRRKRVEDAWLAARAALVCDPQNECADKLARCLITDLQKTPPNRIHIDRRRSMPAHPAESDLKNKLTILMVTDFTRKLERFAHLSPPGAGLVKATYESMLHVFGNRISDCRKILCYDRKHMDAENENRYQAHLTQFAQSRDFDFHVAARYGLQKIIRTLLEKVATPYLLFLEHDWEFQGPEIDIENLIRVFDRNEMVNYVRFNKRQNVISNFDFILEKETSIPGTDLIRTVAHSNNPHLVRVEKLRHDWLPICLNDPYRQKMDLRGKAFGIENPLFKRHMQDVRKTGFAQAHATWGTYIYGRIGDFPRIRHLGE